MKEIPLENSLKSSMKFTRENMLILIRTYFDWISKGVFPKPLNNDGGVDRSQDKSQT